MNLKQPFLYSLSDGDCVLSGLFGNHHRDRRLPIKPRFSSRFFRPVFRITNVTEFDRISTATAYHQLIKVRRLNDAAHRPDSQFARALVHASSRKLKVLSANRVSNLRDRNVEGAQLVRIHPHLNLPRASADDCHLAHTADGFNLLFDSLVGYVGNFSRRSWSGHRYSYDWSGIGIELLDDRLLGCDRQAVHDQVDLVADLLRGDIRIFFK